jgi:cytochrome d ubiquinol oxidase subunit II
MTIDYALIWGGLIAAAVLIYVLLDGFDLGVGILFPFLGGERHQDMAMQSVAPVWDGNETWLILGGGGLLAAFPLAYAILLPALYAPIIAMLLGLILRGVAFEYRWRTRRGRFLWDWSFNIGSLVATFCQGLTLGALVQGIVISDRSYAGGWWDWLTPFTVTAGVALIVGYSLLGSTWLVMKSEGLMRRRAQTIAWIAAFLLILMIIVFTIWTPLMQPSYMARWTSWPALVFVLPVPVLAIMSWLNLLRGLNDHRDVQPFVSTLTLFALCFAVLAISFYPNLIPPDLSVWDAAAPDLSLRFLLAGAIVLLPIILGYTAYTYHLFRGKVDPTAGYH